MSAEDQIRQFAERIVRLEEERKALANDIKDVKAEAKAAGFSPKLIATCVRIMLMEAEKRAEALSGHEELDLYLSAVGLVAGRPDHENRRDAGGRGRPYEAAPEASGSPANSRDSASGLSARPARAVGQTEIVRGTIEPLPLATGSATPACVLSGDAVRGGSSDADTEGPETKSGVTAGESPGPYQIRPDAAGSSAGAPSELRTAQAGHAREIGGSVWALHSAGRP